ncbi:hypothetical protein ACC699_40080, partial [Rhizobium ruizarguesonis]
PRISRSLSRAPEHGIDETASRGHRLTDEGSDLRRHHFLKPSIQPGGEDVADAAHGLDEFDMLATFVRHAGRVLTREVL